MTPEPDYQGFLRKHPQARYWLKRGLHPKAARELAEAGFRTIEDVAGRTREDLAVIPGVGPVSIAKLERLLGSTIPSRKGDWVKRGLPTNIAHALGRAGIDSPEKLGRLTREQFLRFDGLADAGLRLCEALLGRRLDSPVRFWRQQGLRTPAAHRLSEAGIRTVKELAKLPEPALRGLGLPSRDVAACLRLVRERGKPQR